MVLLLAMRAPLDAAKELRDRLNDHAVDTQDHRLSDEVWDIVRRRQPAEPAASAEVSEPTDAEPSS